jgi:hypothetical protein
MTAAEPLDFQFQRLRLLIEQLRAEDATERGGEESVRGWPGRVAKRLGLSKELVDKIGRGEREGASNTSIGKVVQKLGIDRTFFSDEYAKDPDYRDYLRDYEPEEFVKFRRVYKRFDELTEEERVRIKRMKFRTGRTLQNLIDQAELILGGGGVPLRQEATEEKAAREGVQKVPRKKGGG